MTISLSSIATHHQSPLPPRPPLPPPLPLPLPLWHDMPAGFEPSSSAEVDRIPIREGVGLLLRNRNFWLVTIAYAFCTGFYAGWGPLYALIVNWLGPTIAPDPQVRESFHSNNDSNLYCNVPQTCQYSFRAEQLIDWSRRRSPRKQRHGLDFGAILLPILLACSLHGFSTAGLVGNGWVCAAG